MKDEELSEEAVKEMREWQALFSFGDTIQELLDLVKRSSKFLAELILYYQEKDDLSEQEEVILHRAREILNEQVEKGTHQ